MLFVLIGECYDFCVNFVWNEIAKDSALPLLTDPALCKTVTWPGIKLLYFTGIHLLK